MTRPTGGMLLAALSPGAQAAPESSAPPSGGHPDPVAEPVHQAQGEGDVVALTVDDGPNPGETDALLDFLADHDIPAVFCVVGQNITAPRRAGAAAPDRRRRPRAVQPHHQLRGHGRLGS